MTRAKILCRLLTCCMAVVLTGDAVGAQVANQYVVEFRDGTVLQMQIEDHELAWNHVAPDGKITADPRPFSEVQRLELVLNPITERVKQVRRLIDQLGDENYQVREQASRDLIDNAGDFVEVVKTAKGSSDPEVRWRLEFVLQQLTMASRKPRNQEYDRLILGKTADIAENPNELQGDVGDWSCQAVYRDAVVQLNRQTIRTIRRGNLPPPEFIAEVRPGERLTADDLNRFPPDRTQLDFDFTVQGGETNIEMEIDDAYVDRGVKLRTSIENGYVGIFDYQVGGSISARRSSGGRVRGSSDADYQGITTVTFCVPGQPDVPATVHFFGCFLSIVEEDGTLLRFFDPQGRLINELATAQRNSDFVGIASPTPIARVEIHPTEADENYAFDDMLFDAPKAQADAGNPSLFSVVTRSGERLQSNQLTIGQSDVTLGELTIGLEGVSLPKAEVAALIPQFFAGDLPESVLKHWVKTRGGSLLRVALDKQGAQPGLFADVHLGIEELQSVWLGAPTALNAVLDVNLDPASLPVMIHQKKPVGLTNLAFEQNRFVADDAGTDNLSLVYKVLDPIIISPEPQPTSGTGLLRTSDDQVLVLDQDTIELRDWNQEGVALRMKGTELLLDWKQVRSLRLPEPRGQ